MLLASAQERIPLDCYSLLSNNIFNKTYNHCPAVMKVATRNVPMQRLVALAVFLFITPLVFGKYATNSIGQLNVSRSGVHAHSVQVYIWFKRSYSYTTCYHNAGSLGPQSSCCETIFDALRISSEIKFDHLAQRECSSSKHF